MIPTGNIYLQAFNKASGRFIELPENIAALSFITTSTGDISFSQTANFSGFYFSRPIKINGSLDMAPIDIGANNISGSGLGLAANIGFSNKNIITDSNLATGVYYGNYNFGLLNSFFNSIHSYNFGYFNSSPSSELSFNIGGANFISGSKDCFNFGNDNSSQTGNNLYLIGYRNNTESGQNLILIGNENTLNNIYNNLVVGKSNIITASSNINLFSNSNIIITGYNINNFGEQNIYVKSTGINTFGSENIITNSQNENVYGQFNEFINSFENITFGNTNIINGGSDLNIFGSLNNLNGIGNKIYGNNNETNSNDLNSHVYGSFNNLSGTNSTLIIGSYNTANPDVINNLYLIGLTGVTGLGVGQTPFTGITGYRMSNNYLGIAGSGGNFNVLIGYNNSTSLNSNSYIFGENNILLDNDDTYILGKNNYAEQSNESYVFGQENSVSGFKNYVIGNNNIVRSGDYNNILIGVSHAFTGSDKVASVRIASVDSIVEVTPSDIILSSFNRPKYNNQNIIIENDLANLLNPSNGLSNSGIFLNNTFKDPTYINLPSVINIDSFSYTGREDRYIGGFSGANGSNLNAYRFTGFFRKRENIFYTGQHLVFGSFFYQANNENFDIIFSRTLEPITGNWLLTPNTGLGVLFFNRSTNTGVFPLNNWIRTGAQGFSGYNPAPSFVYQNQFTGRFESENIIGTETLNLPYFNNFGSTAYKSNQGISLIYGNHSSPVFSPTWLIVDNYSSGLYYRNDIYNSSSLPQTGWRITGFQNYSGRNPASPFQTLGNSTGVNICLTTNRTGFISSFDPTYGKIYIPFFY